MIFLGTSGSMPTPTRGLPSIAIKRGNEVVLFDCGEGTQARMFKARVGFMKKAAVFITHMHGDHVLGLPGMFQTMSLLGRKRRLEVYGPPGIKAFVHAILDTVKFGLTFPIVVHEVRESGAVYRGAGYRVEGAWADHGDIATLAYALIEEPRPGRFNVERARGLGIPEGPLWKRLQRGRSIVLKGRVIRPEEVLGPARPGRKVVYSGDTRPCDSVIRLARGADVLIHDATLDDELGERAREVGHSTAGQAAQVAKEADVGRLFLFHISPRYKDTAVLLSQARKIFPNTWIANDLEGVDVPFRGE